MQLRRRSVHPAVALGWGGRPEARCDRTGPVPGQQHVHEVDEALARSVRDADGRAALARPGLPRVRLPQQLQQRRYMRRALREALRHVLGHAHGRLQLLHRHVARSHPPGEVVAVVGALLFRADHHHAPPARVVDTVEVKFPAESLEAKPHSLFMERDAQLLHVLEERCAATRNVAARGVDAVEVVHVSRDVRDSTLRQTQ